MIEFKNGDILKENAEAIVNTVNCVGVMGRGIALQFKNAFPENFKAYAAACKKNQMHPGRMLVFETRSLTNPKFVINFPTKRHWRTKSRLEDIQSGLKDLVNTIHKYNILSIAIPPLGCGLGGLSWEEVRPIIEEALRPIRNVHIIIYGPKQSYSTSTEQLDHIREVPNMTAGRAALVELMNRYLHVLLDPFVTLLEVHKLMYLMQESGERLNLTFKKGPYGPYAENLRHVLNAIEGHLISGYADGGDSPRKQLSLIPGAIEQATMFLEQHGETRKRFDKVVQLVDGFESAHGLELLSTVHYVVKNEKSVQTFDDVVAHIYNWNDHKKQFSPHQISIALNVLSEHGWINKITIN